MRSKCRRISIFFFLLATFFQAGLALAEWNSKRILQRQRHFYQTKQWPQFFGHSLYYRTKLLKDEFDARPIALEALGLIKHCQWAAAGTIIEETLKRAKERKLQQDIQLLDRVKSVLKLVKSHSFLPDTGSGTANSSFERPWKIGAQQLLKITSPEFLRVVVDNKCGTGT